MPAAIQLNVTFDEHITQVHYGSSQDDEYFTTSGDDHFVLGADGVFTATLTDGYIIDTATSTTGTISDITDTTFSITGMELNSHTYVNITSKQSGGSTLTFKHFYDAGLQGTGSIKFRHYSQQEPSSGETWVLNDTINVSTNFAYTINFTSNNYSCNTIQSVKDGFLRALQYKANDGQILPAYHDEDGITEWENVAYRTITFSTSPTGDLLTWLQANGTKQGGATGHTLTWNDTSINVRLNSSTLLTSPYTMTENATFKVQDESSANFSSYIINGTEYSSAQTINISDQDITITGGNPIKTGATAPIILINYTAGGGAVTHKVSEIAGYWTLNETITAPTADVNETFNWYYCTYSSDGSFTPNGFIVTATDVKIQGSFSLVTNTLYENNSWGNTTYRYIAIPNSETEISDTFYNWFIANATKRSETFTVTIVNNVDVAFTAGFLKTGATTSPIIENIPANTTVEMNIQLSTDIIQAGAYMYFTFTGGLWENQNIVPTGDVVIISGASKYVNAVLASTGTITLSGYDD